MLSKMARSIVLYWSKIEGAFGRSSCPGERTKSPVPTNMLVGTGKEGSAPEVSQANGSSLAVFPIPAALSLPEDTMDAD